MTKLTQAQLAVVTAADEHLLIDAGAGTGKTTTVVQALCHQLGIRIAVDGVPLTPVATPFTIEQVAAITYTNQAAADLKRKLRSALREGRRPDLAAEVDSARIGTIHSFCGDLLRDFALRAGSRPGRRVLEDGEAAALSRECARDSLRQAIEDDDVPGLRSLLTDRRLKDVGEWVAEASQDTDRLTRWRAGSDALREHESALLSIALRAAELRRTKLERDGVLDFDQMIAAARGLLQDADVRHAVQQRVRLLVLDEFQDVDPAQRDIAFLLGGVDQPDAAPTRLILVGDPKQSIYRFRRADVTLWNAVKDRFSSGAGKVLPLAENFRSKAAILGLVDCVVGKSLDRAVAAGGDRRSFEVAYAPLEARAVHADGDHAVEFLVVAAADDGKTQGAGAVRTAEAEAVARRIAELHAAGTPHGDVAILLAGWGDVAKYEGALRKAGIPSYVLRSEGFWESREVLDCLLALRAIRDPADDVALVGFLKSPFIGVRDDTLLALARTSNGSGLFAAVDKVHCERPLLDRAAKLLRALGALRDRVSVHDLLRRLVDESGFLAVLALSGDTGQQCVANVRKLLRVAATTPDESLGEFLRAIAEQREREDRIAPERLYRERSDVVTVTSIHSAKGLEWPVVFWCDMLREVTPGNDRFLAARESFRVKDESLVDGEGKADDPIHRQLADDLALEQRAEAYRLWYVAATRARKRLVLSGIPLGTQKRSALSPAQVVRESFPALGMTAEVEYRSHDGTLYHAMVTRPGAPVPPAMAPAMGSPDLPLPPKRHTAPAGRRRLSASQLMTFERDAKRWWELCVRGFDGAAGTSISRAGARAIATGLIVHEVLERFEVDGVDIAELIEGAIANRDPDAPEADAVSGIAYRAHIRERVEAATGSPAWREVAGAPSARRELSFTRVLQDGSTINGVLDLAARADGTVRLLDVKTSGEDANALARRYEVQAAVYSDAVRAITGVREVRFTLLTVPAGTAVEVTPTTGVEGLVARLRAWR